MYVVYIVGDRVVVLTSRVLSQQSGL